MNAYIYGTTEIKEKLLHKSKYKIIKIMDKMLMKILV